MSRSRNLAVGDVSLTYESLLRRPIDLTAITREAPENSFSKRTHGKTHGDVAGPVSQQDDARQHQAETYPPYDISLLGGQNAGCGCQGADVDGVSRRKRIEPVARERYAAPMPADRQPVGTFLVEYGL